MPNYAQSRPMVGMGFTPFSSKNMKNPVSLNHFYCQPFKVHQKGLFSPNRNAWDQNYFSSIEPSMPAKNIFRMDNNPLFDFVNQKKPEQWLME